MSTLDTELTADTVGSSPQHDVGHPADAAPWRALLRRAISLPALAILFLVVTVLAAGPLRPLDLALYQPWSEWILPTWRPFAQHVLDRIGGQAVTLTTLAVVALVLARRRRSWRPIIAGTAAEFGFLGIIGLLKLALARPAPIVQEVSFLYGGLFGDGGWHYISYPSGHASEAMLLYGTAALLIARYGRVSRRTVGILWCGVAALTLLAVATSFYLSWHWATDLIGGVVGGAMVLRLVADLDRVLPRWIPQLLDRSPVVGRWIPYGSEIRELERYDAK